jgi:hypothetical protein
VLNVLTGERYKTITNETAGVLKGAYGATPAPVNAELQARVLGDGEEPITVRPADLLEPELDKLTAERRPRCLRGTAAGPGGRRSAARPGRRRGCTGARRQRRVHGQCQWSALRGRSQRGR